MSNANFTQMNDAQSPGFRQKENVTVQRGAQQATNFTGFGTRQAAVPSMITTPGFKGSPNKNSTTKINLGQKKSSTSLSKKYTLKPSGHSSASVNTNVNTHRNLKMK